MNYIQNCEFQIHKLDDKGNIAASYTGASADKLEKDGRIYIEMLASMCDSLNMKEKLTENANHTFLLTFDGENQDQSKKFNGVISKCFINPFNCERTSFEAEIKICSDLESF